MRGVHQLVNIFIAAVWIINGLFCKILNLVPRHQEIVSRFTGEEFSRPVTITIGILEIIMAIWVLSSYKSQLNAIVQIVVIGIMNVLEFLSVPELLLWGKFNALFAAMLMVLIYINEFYWGKNQGRRP